MSDTVENSLVKPALVADEMIADCERILKEHGMSKRLCAKHAPKDYDRKVSPMFCEECEKSFWAKVITDAQLKDAELLRSKQGGFQ